MSQNIELKTTSGEVFEIPERGSLGLLALGYVGVILWRKKRQEIQANRVAEQKDATKEK